MALIREKAKAAFRNMDLPQRLNLLQMLETTLYELTMEIEDYSLPIEEKP